MVDLCLKRLDTMKVTNEISYSMTKLPCHNECVRLVEMCICLISLSS